MTDEESEIVVLVEDKNLFIKDSIKHSSSLISIDHENIIYIYSKCSETVKNAFDNDTTNDINSWSFSEWIKIILPIVKAIEKYNTSDRKGVYKKEIAILITKCVIIYDLDISDETKNLLLNAVNDYLVPSIDIIVYMINNTEKKCNCSCLPCFK